MPIRNVTTTWKKDAKDGGLYVVRSTKPGSHDKVRIGAGGNHGGQDGLRTRLKKHNSPPPKNATLGTHDHQPYGDVLFALALDGWSAPEIDDGEHVLYRPFLIRFPRLVGGLKDKSIFVVPLDADLTDLFAEAEDDLRAMEKLRA